MAHSRLPAEVGADILPAPAEGCSRLKMKGRRALGCHQRSLPRPPAGIWRRRSSFARSWLRIVNSRSLTFWRRLAQSPAFSLRRARASSRSFSVYARMFTSLKMFSLDARSCRFSSATSFSSSRICCLQVSRGVGMPNQSVVSSMSTVMPQADTGFMYSNRGALLAPS